LSVALTTRNTSFVNINNCCYLVHPSVKNSRIYKYDGQKVYLAGMPTSPTINSVTAVGAGGVTAGVHRYKVVLKNKDNQNNIVESNATPYVEISLAVANDVDIVFNTLANYDGDYNNTTSTVNGNQVGVNTINVTNNALAIGDTAYFLDRSTGNYVERTVTGYTGTTITISGAAVNVNNNDILSNNSRAKIYRTKAGGIEYYLVVEIPMSVSTTQTFRDTVADASLGEKYIEPDQLHDAPPRASFLAEHQGLLVISGAITNGTGTTNFDIPYPNTIFYSSSEGPEYFPPENQFDVPASQRGAISAIVSDNENAFLIGKERGIYYAFGDFASGNINTATIAEGNVGCPSHFGIVRINKFLCFPSYSEFVAISNGVIDKKFGQEVTGIFTNNFYKDSSVSTAYSLDQRLFIAGAVGIAYPEESLAIWYFPNPSYNNGVPLADGNYSKY
jgi:hypothetical protein